MKVANATIPMNANIGLLPLFISPNITVKNKKEQRIILITTKANKSYTEFNFKTNDTLLFGRESAGVPSKVHKMANEKLKTFDTSRSQGIIKTHTSKILASNS